VTEAAEAEEVVGGVDARARLGKLVGLLGSSAQGERENALAAVDRALRAAHLSYGWLADLIARGDLPDGDNERVFKRLIVDRLREGLQVAWSLGPGEANELRSVLVRIEAGLRTIDLKTIDHALNIATKARARAR